MKVEIVTLPAIRIVSLAHVGPYDQISEAYSKLFAWIELEKVPIERTIGIYYDNPEFTPVAELRSAACVEVPESFQLGDTGGLPLELGTIKAGTYAKSTVTGPYEQLERAWKDLFLHVEDGLGRSISEEPAFEVYINDPIDTPASALITELYLPLA